MLIREHPSPNFDLRGGRDIRLIVLHYTGMRTARAALERLCDRAARVSAHYMIDEQGRILRLVRDEHRAWHAGHSYWRGEDDVNAISLGIELVNGGHDFGLPPYPEAQMESLLHLLDHLCHRFGIDRREIVGHSDVAFARKQDPGEKFDWEVLARNGFGIWPATPLPPPTEEEPLAPGSEGDAVRVLQRQLAAFGYGLHEDGYYGPLTQAAVAAFQRHFNQENVTGRADPDTLARLDWLVSNRMAPKAAATRHGPQPDDTA